MHAIIVDLQGEWAAALCENGSIEKIPDMDYEIGQQIELPAAAPALVVRKSRGITKLVRRIGPVAAALVLAAAIGGGISYATPYGTVSLDSDASIEYTVNRYNRIIGVTAVNEAGTAVLDALDSSLIHKDIEDAVAITVGQIEAGGYLDEDAGLIISVGMKSAEHAEELTERLNEITGNGMPVPAQVIPVTMDDIETAHRNDMTAGQKWLAENAAAGTDPENRTETAPAPDGIGDQNAAGSDMGTAPVGGDPADRAGADEQDTPAGNSDPGIPDDIPAEENPADEPDASGQNAPAGTFTPGNPGENPADKTDAVSQNAPKETSAPGSQGTVPAADGIGTQKPLPVPMT